MAIVLRKQSTKISSSNLKLQYENLLMSINALPGITVSTFNLHKPFEKIIDGWNGVLISFTVNDGYYNEGLFFLSRCLSSRYWEHGNKWRIEVQVNDDSSDHMRPIIYFLYRPINKNSIPPTTEIDIVEECRSLIHCMNSHFNNEAFMTGFNMNKEKYSLEDEIVWNRSQKLNTLEI